MICGPLAFNPWVGSGGSLVGIATAAQHMMFRWLAEELEDSEARVVELVIGSFIRDRQTQPQSRLPAEAVGAYVAQPRLRERSARRDDPPRVVAAARGDRGVAMTKSTYPMPGQSLADSGPTAGKVAFSNGVKVGAGELLFVSGQLAFGPDRELVGAGDVRAQTRQVLEDVKRVLDLAGADVLRHRQGHGVHQGHGGLQGHPRRTARVLRPRQPARVDDGRRHRLRPSRCTHRDRSRRRAEELDLRSRRGAPSRGCRDSAGARGTLILPRPVPCLREVGLGRVLLRRARPWCADRFREGAGDTAGFVHRCPKLPALAVRGGRLRRPQPATITWSSSRRSPRPPCSRPSSGSEGRQPERAHQSPDHMAGRRAHVSDTRRRRQSGHCRDRSHTEDVEHDASPGRRGRGLGGREPTARRLI